MSAEGYSSVPPGMSDEEFLEWAKDPANARLLEEEMKRVVAAPKEHPPARVAAARHALAKRDGVRALEAARKKMGALMEVMNRPAGSMIAEERLRECNTLVDEATDAFLDAPEPYRTDYLKQLLPIRERLRAVRIKED